MIEEMSRNEVLQFVASQRLGRVGCHVGGETYVVPVIYAWDDECIYVYTTEGKKVEMMRENPRVCFEIDEYHASGAWRSVIVQGQFEELTGREASQALTIIASKVSSNRSSSMTRGGGRSPVAFRIRTIEVTGRKVEVAPSGSPETTTSPD